MVMANQLLEKKLKRPTQVSTFEREREWVDLFSLAAPFFSLLLFCFFFLSIFCKLLLFSSSLFFLGPTSCLLCLYFCDKFRSFFFVFSSIFSSSFFLFFSRVAVRISQTSSHTSTLQKFFPSNPKQKSFDVRRQIVQNSSLIFAAPFVQTTTITVYFL